MEARQGDVLLEAGAVADACFVLTAGLLRVDLPDGTQRPLAPPALVGEMAVVLGVPRSATVVVETPSTLLRIPATMFRAALDAYPDFAAEVRETAEVLAADAFLRRDSPFADLPSDALAQLARRLAPVSYPTGATIVEEGASDDDVYLVRSGHADVVRAGDGGERRLSRLGPGSFLGEMAALTGAARTATVRAVEPVVAYRLAAEDFRPLMKAHATLVRRFGDALHARHSPRATAHVTAVACPDEPDSLILRNEETGVYVKVSREAYAILSDLDGKRTLRDLVLRHFQRSGAMDPSGVFRTIATLQSSGFATAPQLFSAASADGLRLRLMDLLLAPRLELRSADRLGARLHAALRPFATRPAAVAALLLGAIGAVALVAQFREISIDAFGLAGIAIAWAALLFAGVGHEVAHALACKRFGSRLGRAGIGLMWFSPVIWVDTTDTWTLDRRRRVLVNAAGPLFNVALGGAAALAAIPSTGAASELLLWFAGMNYLSVAFNLSPLLEFDGYYALSDLTNTPMLRHQALRFVFRDLADRPRLPRTRFEWGLLAFAILAVLYVAAVAAFVAFAVPGTVRAVLAQRISSEWLVPAGVAAALVIVLLTVEPLVASVRAARATADDLSAA